MQNLHRVFDPFYTTKPVGKGTGLGLSICFGIVKEHGGEIEVRNSPRIGATFAITLPVFSDLHASETEDPTREQDVVAGQVLLVGDEETVLHLERGILAGRGVSVRAARSANEAISVLQRDTFDAVVVDRQLLGEVSTHELYRWIEQSRPQLVARVIFTASDAHDGEFSAAMRKAGYLFVSKPFGMEEFWRVVQTALRSDTPNPVRR
jgi:two-component system NtrC family sensor kinase